MKSNADPHPNFKLLEAFYQAFSHRDHETMNTIYDEHQAHFSDAVFVNLDAAEVKKMWKMLCTRGKDLVITYQVLEANENAGKAEWQASYTFSGTGKKVINRIQSEFTFEKGKVVAQRDTFDFYAWSKQAFGLTGWLLGWTSWFKSKVRTQAKSALNRFDSTR